MPITRLQYLFDPLCGWCYASAPALAGLAEAFPDTLELLPSGLFSGSGARDLTREWADHAWENDQRIASLTGQRFSKAYHEDILLGLDMPFDSGAMNRALTAVRTIDRALEPRLLHHLQVVRYVEGKDTSSAAVVGQVSAGFVSAEGHALDADEFTHRLQSDLALAQQTDARTRAVQSQMAQLGVRGVPMLLVHIGNSISAVSGGPLYAGPEMMLADLQRLTDGQLNVHANA